jgi:alkylhydroperoxidase family enzyme
MTSWLAQAGDEAALIDRLPVLAPKLASLRADAAAECPGRTAALIQARATQLIAGTGDLDGFGALDAGELTVVALTEQFLIDAHGIDDALVARLGEHYTPAEQIAIMFQLAFADGFTKFRRIFGVD